jgi:hypothetical protein
MEKFYDYRSVAYKIALDLDSSNILIMQLISDNRMAGKKWNLAISAQKESFQNWERYLNTLNG